MHARSLLTVLVSATLAAMLAPGAALAQAGRPAGSFVGVNEPKLSPPAACAKTASDWRMAQIAPALAEYRKATDSTRPALQKAYVAAYNAANAGAQKMAAECAAKFSVATVPAAQLMDLIALYNAAGTRPTAGGPPNA